MTQTTGAVPATLDELAERYGQAWNDHDLETILALQTPDSTFVMHGTGGPQVCEGIDACRGVYDLLLKTFPDQHFDVQRLEVSDDLYVCESILTGTLAQPFGLGDEVFEPRGQSIRVEIVDVMRCAGNLVAHKSSWVDGFAMRRQLAG